MSGHKRKAPRELAGCPFAHDQLGDDSTQAYVQRLEGEGGSSIASIRSGGTRL